MPYCLVILSREAMPQAFTFCAFPWWGTSTAARIVWLFPSWLGAGTCSPSGWIVGLVRDTREFCNALVALASSHPSLCTQAHKAQVLPSHWDFRPGTLEKRNRQLYLIFLKGFGLMNVQ